MSLKLVKLFGRALPLRFIQINALDKFEHQIAVWIIQRAKPAFVDFRDRQARIAEREELRGLILIRTINPMRRKPQYAPPPIGGNEGQSCADKAPGQPVYSR